MRSILLVSAVWIMILIGLTWVAVRLQREAEREIVRLQQALADAHRIIDEQTMEISALYRDGSRRSAQMVGWFARGGGHRGES